MSVYTQKIDVNFGKDGLRVFIEQGMTSSDIIDFHVLKEDKINILFESDIKRYLVRINGNGSRDIKFDLSNSDVAYDLINPVAITSSLDGGVYVLSDKWKEENWIITINRYDQYGYLDPSFGIEGEYEKNILDNVDNNYGRHMYVSSKGEIIVVAKVCQFHMVKETEKVAILKVSEVGSTISSKLYDDNYFNLNCSAMRDDQLFVAYSESIDNGAERATYIVGLDSDEMTTSNFDCLNIDSEYQSFDQLIVANSKMYASNIQNELDNLYTIRKYDINGDVDTFFKNSSEMDINADIYNTDFVVNDIGEIFIVSPSFNNEKEIIIQKLMDDGGVDRSFGMDGNGIAKILLKYPITSINKIRLDSNEGLYISGNMTVRGGSFGFMTKLKLNAQKLKKEQLEKFIEGILKQ